MSRSLKVAWGSLSVSSLALAMKAGAYWLTGSVTLYSGALTATINVAAAVGALVAVWVSEHAPYADHSYRHNKAQSLSAGVEGVLVLVAAVAIGREAWDGLGLSTAVEFSSHRAE